MTAGGYGYGYMRATDQDRENVRSMLQDAHAEGRLDWQEFDARTTALLRAQTYDQLAALTADLPNRLPAGPPQLYYRPPAMGVRTTNSLAIASLVCGIGQVFFWLASGIPAIVLGHIARKQIRKTGEDGDGMALAGLILGYIGLGLTVLGAIFLVVTVAVAVHGHNSSPLPQPGG